MKYTYLAALLIFSLACDCQEIEITALRPTNRCPNGELNLSINDGLGPYDITWSWESGSSSFVLEQHVAVNGNSGIEDLDGLPTGSYTVNITNSICGIYEQTIELQSGLIFGDSDRIEANVDHVQTCGVDGTNDGSIAITRIIGVSPPYSIRWTGPGITPGTSGISVENLRDGSYTVTIKTADGCELTRTFQICCCEQNINNPDRPKDANKTDRCVSTELNFPVSILRDILFSPDDATSFNGELKIIIDGGNQNNELTWTGPNGFFSSREHIFGLGVGEYCATVDNGCSEATRCFELVDCSERPVELDGRTINSCQSRTGADVFAGAINLEVRGGWPPFTYRWSDGIQTTTPQRRGLPAGNYCVTVSDDKGCRPATQCFQIGYNFMVPSTATGQRCGQTWFCNGSEYVPDFQPGETDFVFDDPDCRIQHEYCFFDSPPRRMPTGERFTPYTGYRLLQNCTLQGQCPSDGSWTDAAVGQVRRVWTMIPLDIGICNGLCPVCHFVDICEVNFEGEEISVPYGNSWNPTNIIATSSVFPGSGCPGDCVFTCNGTPTVGQDLVSPQCIGNDVCQPNIADGQVDVSKYGLSEISTVADMILLATGGNGPLHAKKFLFPTGATLDSRLEDLDFNGEISTLIQVKDWDELAAHLSNENSNGAYQQSSVLADGENFKVYPVPTTGWLNIELSDNKGIQASVLRVIDVTGTTQFKMTLEANVSLLNIDLSGLPNGVYFIQLSTKDGASFTKRITLIK